MIKNFNFIFVTFFGIGKIKFAPGTFSSFVTIIILFCAFNLLNISSNYILLILFTIFIYSFYAVSEYIEKKDNKDPSEVVIDEVIGQSIPIYLYEISHSVSKNSFEEILIYVYIFFLFRFFDIKKPFPVGYFDKNFKNSFGVIMDDVVAGLYVVLTLIIFMIIKSKLFT